ncbi:hypothetical protein EJ03DRAFT_2412 [Teratosphaeria nubilosa]|uniref:Uncharacterized protein n=1 Tax=Teratosphaeria nubilosa TaxID=161662 RepID=A0A6G1LP49_9PEZI|nr:hypothetical protein EJ03DRAFT_2412 [Teratosphaeria nubilosa]
MGWQSWSAARAMRCNTSRAASEQKVSCRLRVARLLCHQRLLGVAWSKLNVEQEPAPKQRRAGCHEVWLFSIQDIALSSARLSSARCYECRRRSFLPAMAVDTTALHLPERSPQCGLRRNVDALFETTTRRPAAGRTQTPRLKESSKASRLRCGA